MRSDLCLCLICYSEYNDSQRLPKIFPCGHTICSSCLQGIVISQNRRKCPVCSQTIPSNMAISTNYVLLNLVEEMKSNRRLMCRYHPDHKADHVCLQDKCRVCLYCKVYGEHKDHDCVAMKDFQEGVEIKKKEIETVLDSLRKSSIDISESLKFYGQDKSKLIKTLEMNFNKMISFISQMKIDTIRKVQKNFDKAVKNLDHHKVYEEVQQKITMLENKVSMKVDESSDESISAAFVFLNENLGALSQANFPSFGNQSGSTKFFSQTSKILGELQKDVLKRLGVSSGELEIVMLSPDLSLDTEMSDLIENLGDSIPLNSQNKINLLEQDTTICISTLKGPLKLKVKYSDTIDSIQKKLVEMEVCGLNDYLFYQNIILKKHLTVFDYNIQINHLIQIRKARRS